MTTFQDGPAKGKTLMLTRAPMFLRVVEAAGKFDALDQPEDTPADNETLSAYVLTGAPSLCHINMGRKGGGFYPIATYALCALQPSDEVFRSAFLWRKWCEVQPHPFKEMRGVA